MRACLNPASVTKGVRCSLIQNALFACTWLNNALNKHLRVPSRQTGISSFAVIQTRGFLLVFLLLLLLLHSLLADAFARR